MTANTALLDANVLYPAPLRDLLMQLAVSGLFRAKWTADIHEEWIESLMHNEPYRDRRALERTRNLMDRAVRDCLVTGYETRISQLSLPDANDRHVLAAAITAGCDVIVSYNLRDFPGSATAPYDIEVLHPDTFLQRQLDDAPSTFCGAVRKVRSRLRNPPFSIEQYLDTMRQQGLPLTTGALIPLSNLL